MRLVPKGVLIVRVLFAGVLVAGAIFVQRPLRGAEPAPGSETLPESETLLAERGKLVLSDDFREPLGRSWQIQAPIWETLDGALKATHRKPFPDNHGPVMQQAVALSGAIVEVSFKLEGSAQATIHFNKKNGHLCRALVQGGAFYVIRRDSGGDKGIRLDEQKLSIAPDQWHVLRVEVCGREMLATLDGKETLFGARDDLDQPITALGLESSRGSAWFKNLRVWEASPKADWPATKAKLEAARAATKNSP